MKPIRALITWSLLGSLWLAACSGSNKKRVLTPEADAGAAGESGGTSGVLAGAAGVPNPEAGAAGTMIGGSAGALGGSAGEGGAAGGLPSGYQGGEAGTPAVCLNDLLEAPAEAGAGGGTSLNLGTTLHAVYRCDSLLAALSPTYDGATGKLALDTAPLGPRGGGDFSFYYEYSDGQNNLEGCNTSQVSPGNQPLQLALDPPPLTSDIYITALQLQGECGDDATLLTEGANGTCFSLRLHDVEGSWQIDCYEGGCFPACGAIPPQVPVPPENPIPPNP